MEQTQIEKLFAEVKKKDERIKELETALIEMKKSFDQLNEIANSLLDKAEKQSVLTFDGESGELIKM